LKYDTCIGFSVKKSIDVLKKINYIPIFCYHKRKTNQPFNAAQLIWKMSDFGLHLNI
jgi:hypothetical protein